MVWPLNGVETAGVMAQHYGGGRTLGGKRVNPHGFALQGRLLVKTSLEVEQGLDDAGNGRPDRWANCTYSMYETPVIDRAD